MQKLTETDSRLLSNQRNMIAVTRLYDNKQNTVWFIVKSETVTPITPQPEWDHKAISVCDSIKVSCNSHMYRSRGLFIETKKDRALQSQIKYFDRPLVS